MSVIDNNACLNGRTWEDTVGNVVVYHTGLPIINCTKKGGGQYNDKIDGLYHTVPYSSIFEKNNEIKKSHPRTMDYILVLFGKIIWLDCKSQESTGSVDQKYPYMFLSMEKQPQLDYGIFVLECSGASNGSKEWVVECCEKSLKKLTVMDEKQLHSFLNQCVQTQSIVWKEKTLK